MSTGVRRNLLAVLLGAVALVGLGGCATKPKPTGLPVVQKIALIGASEPLELSLRNENGIAQMLSPITAIGFAADSRTKAKEFNAAMFSRGMTLAYRLTDAVTKALRDAGYEVEVLQGLNRPAEEPDDIDYDKIKTDADARHAYPSFVAVMSRLGEIQTSLETGADALSELLARQIVEALSKQTRRTPP